jgi:cyclase
LAKGFSVLSPKGLSVFPRLIPVILVENGRAVHTVRFRRGQYLGDPLNVSRILGGLGADEVMILDRSPRAGATMLANGGLARVSREVFVPVSFGGGLRTASDIAAAFRAGADKVILRADRPWSAGLVSWASSEFGSQAVATCINFRPAPWPLISDAVHRVREVVSLALQFSELGAGEIILQSVLRAGTQKGLDTEAMVEVRESVTCPVVLSGGASSPEDIDNAFRQGFSGVAISTMFSLDQRSGTPLVSYFSDKEKREFHWLENRGHA